MSAHVAASLIAVVLASCAAWAGSSNSLMDVSPDGTRLLVSNADNGTVTVVDVAAGKSSTKSRSATNPKASPGSAAAPWPPSPFTATTLLSSSTPRRVRWSRSCTWPTNRTASSPADGSRAYVTHEYPGIVSEIDLKERQGAARDPGRLHGPRHRPRRRREKALRHRVLHRLAPRRGPRGRQGGR